MWSDCIIKLFQNYLISFSDSNIKLVHVLEHKRLRGTWLPFPTESLPCHISALQKCATWHKWQSGEFVASQKLLILSLSKSSCCQTRKCNSKMFLCSHANYFVSCANNTFFFTRKLCFRFSIHTMMINFFARDP